MPYARLFDRRQWPNQQVIEAIVSDGHGGRVLIGTDTAGFNANNLELIVAARRLPLRILTSAYVANREEALSALTAADYFVYKDGGEPEAHFFNQYKGVLVSHVLDMPSATPLSFQQSSPDRGSVRLFRLH
jgi:hypothetical protein